MPYEEHYSGSLEEKEAEEAQEKLFIRDLVIVLLICVTLVCALFSFGLVVR